MKTRLAASIALAAALLVGTAGCTLAAQVGTIGTYQPSDGVSVTVGKVKVLNIIALSDNGEDISLLMTIVNNSGKSLDVNFQYENADGERVTETASLRGHTSTGFGADGQGQIVLRDAGATVGGLIKVYVQPEGQSGKQVLVPVLDGGTAAYSDLIPGPAPTPTETATPEPTETPAG